MFKKKLKVTRTIQSVQQEFNETVFELGDLSYRVHMVESELKRLGQEIHTRTQKLNGLGKEAQTLRGKVKEELAKTAEQGAPNAEEAPKTS